MAEIPLKNYYALKMVFESFGLIAFEIEFSVIKLIILVENEEPLKLSIQLISLKEVIIPRKSKFSLIKS